MTPAIPDPNLDVVGSQLWSVAPEIILVHGMCAVILLPFINRKSWVVPTVTMFATLLLATVFSLLTISMPGEGEPVARSVFFGMLTIDPFSQFVKVLVYAFTMLVMLQWLIVRRDRVDPKDIPDFACLMLGAVMGMSLMASASNLLMIVIAIESASLPSYALAGWRKTNRLSTEGSLKYVIFGAATSAIMIYGMSLIYGVTGTLALSGVAAATAAAFTGEAFPMLLAVGIFAMMIGIAFKLSAVPTHMWCPDVFQGAAFEVTTFLSVASKGAAAALLARVLFNFGQAAGATEGIEFTGLAAGIAILGGITATWGNLVALHQTNIKRLLAYSSIAHAGYMIMGLAALAVAQGAEAQIVAEALLYYLLVYVFMNTGAFTVAALIKRQTATEDINDYTGLMQRAPALTVLLSIFLLSLFGMPGLGGFLAKIYIAKAMLGLGLLGGSVVIGVLLINTLLSLYYYLRPIYFMVLVPDEKGRPRIDLHPAAAVLLSACAAGLIWTGLELGAMRLIQPFGSMHDGSPTPAATAGKEAALEDAAADAS